MSNSSFENRTKLFVRTAIYSAVLATASNAYSENSFALEEVVVTAQKRSERLIEVPISISNISAESIEQSGIKELKELEDLTPNLQISQNSDFGTLITIRGVGANSRNIGFDSRVGVYLDGVYIGQSPAANQGLVDLERVEVLRGPQGTLFGKNTVAGAINLISKKPDGEFRGSVGINLGNFNNRELQASVNLPINDTNSVKVYVNKTTRDGYVKNLAINKDIQERDATSGRIHYRSSLSPKLEMNISADYLTQDRLGFNGEPLTDTLGFFQPSEGRDKYVTSDDRALRENKENKGYSLSFDYELDNGFSFKSITAYRYTELFYDASPDYSPEDFLFVQYTDTYKQTTQEFQLISPDEGALKYIVGLYIYKQDSATDRDAFGGLGTVNHPVFGPVPITVFGIDPTKKVVDIDGSVDTESYAIFGNGTYDLSDKLTLGLGFRYSEETKDVSWDINGLNSGAFAIGTTQVIDSRTDRNFAPSVSLNYAISDNSYTYGRVSSGFKSGGYNLDFINVNQVDAGIDFNDESVTSYEVGYKGQFPEQNLRVNVALFYSEFDDYQVNQYVDLGGGRTALSIENAATVVTQGIEMDVTYRPTANLELTAAFGSLDATFDSFPGGGAGGSDASGNELPYAPGLTASLSGQYYYPLPSLGATLLLRADYSYTSSYFITINNDDGHTLLDGSTVDFGKLDSYGMVGARIGLLSDSEDWDVSIWGRNLNDSDHLNYSFRDFFGTILAGYAMPRTFGIEARYNF